MIRETAAGAVAIPGEGSARRGERGSALVIAALVTLIATLLGLSFLMMAQTENRIAENEKVAAQALYFAEAGSRVVQRWFDRPRSVSATMFDGNLDFPAVGQLRRDLRRIDVDGAGPSAAVATDGDAGGAQPHYKQGVDRDGDGIEDLFDRPYRAGPLDSFCGTAAGPDIRISRSESEAAKVFLDGLSEKLMPGFPAARAGISARLATIDVYGPPYLEVAGTWSRYGIASVAVTAQIVKTAGTTEVILAQRTVRTVVNEVPYRRVFGPLHSCNELNFDGGFNVHWGAVTAAGPRTSVVPGDPGEFPESIPREIPPSPTIDWFAGQSNTTRFEALKATLEAGVAIEDPWFRLIAGFDIQNFPGTTAQVFPPDASGHPDHSNIFRLMHPVACPDFAYATWKAIAQSGGSDVRYFTWVTGDQFSENGSGPPTSFATLTGGATGLFFFDTRTQTAPLDANGDGIFDNLTPAIHLQGDSWSGMRGFLYLNAEALSIDGSGEGGRDATYTLPGEPYRDANDNGRFDPGEPHINLNYNALAGIASPIRGDSGDRFPARDASGTPPSYNATGPRFTARASFWGLLYNSGRFGSAGRPRFLGSLISGSGQTEPSGSAEIYFDPTLLSEWPPADWPLPRVVVTRWETDP